MVMDKPMKMGPWGRAEWNDAKGAWRYHLTPEGQEQFDKAVGEWRNPALIAQRCWPVQFKRMVRLLRDDDSIRQAGLVGLWKAALTFVPGKCDFITWAAWKVRRELTGLCFSGHDYVWRPSTGRAQFVYPRFDDDHDEFTWDSASLMRAVKPPEVGYEFEAEDAAEAVRRGIDGLTEKQQKVVREQFGMGRNRLSFTESARASGVSRTARDRLFRRGLNSLKKRLARPFGFDRP